MSEMTLHSKHTIRFVAEALSFASEWGRNIFNSFNPSKPGNALSTTKWLKSVLLPDQITDIRNEMSAQSLKYQDVHLLGLKCSRGRRHTTVQCMLLTYMYKYCLNKNDMRY